MILIIKSPQNSGNIIVNHASQFLNNIKIINTNIININNNSVQPNFINQKNKIK